MPGSRALLCSYLLPSMYSLGGAAVEEFVYYPAWKVVGATEFPAFHQSLSDRLIPAFVAPFFLSVLLSGLLIWARPTEVSAKLVLLAFLMNLTIFLATIGWAIPIQMQLGKEQSLEAIDRLIGIDRPWRLLPGLVVGAANCGILFGLCSGAGRRALPPPGQS